MLLGTLSCLGALAAGGWATTSFVSAAAETSHPPQGRFVTLPQGRVHLVDTGEPFPGAPVVLMIHGASSLHADLLAVLGRGLRGKARLIAIDRPGHGWSDRLGGREMADPARQAEALIAAMKAIDINRFTIIAHSLAGAVSTRMALEWPDMVAGMVLLGAVTHPWPGKAISWYYHPTSNPALGPVFSRLLAIPAGSAMLDASIASVFAPQAVPDSYAENAQIRLVLRPATFEANAQDVAAVHDFVEAQQIRYGELAMPVVAIAGEDDTIVSSDIHSRALVRAVRNGRLIILPGVGHMPHHAVPDLIVREVLAMGAGMGTGMDAGAR